MNKLILFIQGVVFICLAIQGHTQIVLGSQYDREGVRDAYELFIQVEEIQSLLEDAPPLAYPTSDVVLSLPLANGEFRDFSMFEAPLMQEGLAVRYPEIRNYKGFDLRSPDRQVRLNVGPLGVFAIIVDQEDQSIIQPWVGEREKHDLYFSGNTYSNWTCDVSHEELQGKTNSNLPESTNNCTVNGTDYYTYDIVVTTTGEFYNLNGGTMSSALNALTNRLAATVIPYERDLAMTFQLVSNNDIVMFTDPTTDPYTDPTNRSVSIDQAESTIESNFTSGEYDIGHGYHEITCGSGCGWGGLAGVAVACLNGSKARAWTYQPNDIATNTVWSHEFGHQLSCWHTNYGCGNTGCHRYEPGQGVTIMSTSAGCSSGPNFYAPRVDYFHAKSIDAILEFTNNGLFNNNSNNCNQNTWTGWSPCVQSTNSGNTPPTVTANPNSLNLTIPVNTPFFLEGTATDPEGDPMTYTWVDYNTNVSNSTSPQNSASSTTAPLFRWFAPGNETTRLFPQLPSILNGNNTAGTGEVLPAVGRTMDFRFLARDNASPYGAIGCDEITVTVDGGSGPFEITSQNSSTSWTAGNNATVTWNVNNTDQAPISAFNVDILLSTDGGQNFSISLASNVPNDGSQSITIPSINTSDGRIKLQPSGNYIFFDMNDAVITISDPGCQANAYSISPTNQVTAEEGDPALNLDMENEYVNPSTSLSDNTSSSDPTANIAFEDGGSCSTAGNNPYYKLYDFNVSSSGTYSVDVTSSNGPVLMNFYYPDFNPTSVCQNWIGSNGTFTGSGVSLDYTYDQSLNAGQTYQLNVNGFNTGENRSFNLSFSGPGDVYLGYIPISGFSYTYAIVNEGSGNIVDFDANTDLTNEPPGSYTVYGVHYDNNVNLASYEGGAFSTFQSDITGGTICASISSNSRPVQIEAMLPLTFLQFTVQKEERQVDLEWDITDAFNVSHFRVEKWDQRKNNFRPLGEVVFQDRATQYKFRDATPSSGSNSYRIASVDFDGYTLYTPVRSVFFDSNGTYNIYPSPVSDHIQISGPVEKIIHMRIFDKQGILIRSILNAQGQSNIPVFDLSNGMYFLEIQSKNGPDRKRFVVQH